jgi:outer membrane protein OmpA-like peptidoglycan-associated protein
LRSSGWVVAAGLLAAVDGHAEVTRNIELSVFDPTPTTTVGTTFQVQTPDVGHDGDLVISSWASYAYNPLVLGTVQNDDPVVRHRTMLTLGGAYAFGGRFEAGARMPFYVQSGEPYVQPMPGVDPTYSVPPASGAVLGDLALHGRARLWRNDTWMFGGGLTLKLPTAGDSEFAGTDMPSLRALVMLSYSPDHRLSFTVNAGGILRKQAEFANVIQGNGAMWGAAGSYRIANKLFLDAEAFGELVPGGRKNEMDERSMQASLEWLAGLRVQATDQVSLGLAGGRGITNGIGAPAVRGVFTLAYTPSGRALPPLHRPEVEVPIDPNTNDADFDKLVDAQDKCPSEREDKDGFQDTDGCPDLDNDKDGVPDEKDKCATQAEDGDGFQDTDGCPDDDNDNDGIADDDDKCRNEAEKINGVDDGDGCPDKGESLVISTPDRLELLESVAFNGNAVSKASANVLGQLATTLRARHDIIRLRVGVHVQPSKSVAKDQALSDKRAAAVRDWLVKAGIETERIDPKGFGSTQPLVTPTQKGAAEINDRVELIILERK